MQNLRRIGSQAMVVFKHKQDVKEWVDSFNEKDAGECSQKEKYVVPK